jgi:RNA polymerase sigma-70 factor (ECF subfamily)
MIRISPPLFPTMPGRAGATLSLPAGAFHPKLDLTAHAPEASRRGCEAGQGATVRAAVEAGAGGLAADQDFVLIDRIAKGDKLALKALFARHEVRVFRFALRLVRREEVAEDIVADTFLDAWRQAPSFERRSSVATWLMAIARFKALSELRKRGEAALDEEAIEAIEDEADTPEIVAQKKDKSAVLRACIDKLSPEHREVIDLVYYHDRSIEEVSRIVGAPENTVKTRMFHARKRLSELARLAGIDRGWP